MKPEYFVQEDSIVRKIWGRADTILLIFAGASAEFALNKAVDWLYFTGKLPSDPLGRLFSTVEYARVIVFSELDVANRSIDKISMIHAAVEHERGSKIPEWAYRDVLFMLIDYSIRSYELIVRKMSLSEKQETFDVFNRVGKRMGLIGLPENYVSFLKMRDEHLLNDLDQTEFSRDLFMQYKKHLGSVRYRVLLEGQKLLVPARVRILMSFSNVNYLAPSIPCYKLLCKVKLDSIVKAALFPPRYKERIYKLDVL